MRSIVPTLFAIALTVIPLEGCVDRSTTLQNSQGQAIRCHALGFGIVGSIVAASEQRNCVDQYQAAGYAVPGAIPIAPQTTAISESVSPSVVTSKDGRIRLTLPSGWLQSDPPKSLSSADIFARNPTLGGSLFVASDDKRDIQDLEVYGRTLRTLLANKLSDTQLSDVQKTSVNSHAAVRFDVSGVVNGVRVHYLMTVIEGESRVMKLNVWTVESKFAEHRDELAALATGLTEPSATIQGLSAPK